jgi:Flp pilus assembly pilin Flp
MGTRKPSEPAAAFLCAISLKPADRVSAAAWRIAHGDRGGVEAFVRQWGARWPTLAAIGLWPSGGEDWSASPQPMPLLHLSPEPAAPLSLVERVLADTAGVAAVEYVVLTVGIAGLVAVAATVLGGDISTALTSIGGYLAGLSIPG